MPSNIISKKRHKRWRCDTRRIMPKSPIRHSKRRTKQSSSESSSASSSSESETDSDSEYKPSSTSEDSWVTASESSEESEFDRKKFQKTLSKIFPRKDAPTEKRKSKHTRSGHKKRSSRSVESETDSYYEDDESEE